MTKPNLAKFAKGAKALMTRHSPEILTGIGIAGMITTTVLAVRATPKALRLLEEEKKKKQVEKLPGIETVKTAWKCYIPAAVTGAASVACLIGASSVNLRRNAALTAAYKLSETALTEYKDKVAETIGEKKEQQIRDAIKKDHVQQNPVSKNEVIITEKGNTLCYDTISGRYFRSDIDRIKKIVNELNRRMLSEMYISVNDLYCELGIPVIGTGDDLGWNIDRGYIDIDFGSQLADDGTPCLVLEYALAPRYDYMR